jgi:hypothetical protein
MDENIGRLLDFLDSQKLSEDTLVIFTSDNARTGDVDRADPNRGGKDRVPAIFRWKGVIAEESHSDKFIMAVDLFPTLLELVNARLPGHARIDGISFAPVLLDGGPSALSLGPIVPVGDERLVLWHSVASKPRLSSFAAQAYGVKVIWTKSAEQPAWRVFDMRIDPTEADDLFPRLQQRCPELLKELTYKNSSHLQLPSIAARESGRRSLRLELQILSLVRQLQLELYLFRFRGQSDAVFYSQNPPHRSNQLSCAVRSLEFAETFPWLSSEVLPVFCGSSAAADIPFSHRCACNVNSNCSDFWLLTADKYRDFAAHVWTLQPAVIGLTHFAPLKGSQLKLLTNVLRWSEYRGVCSSPFPSLALDEELIAHHDAIGRSSSHRIELLQPSCDDTGPARPLSPAVTNSLGDISSLRSWRRRCTRSVFSDDQHDRSVLLAAACAYDRPLLRLQWSGKTLLPVPLCLESFQKLLHQLPAENVVDDALMHFLSHLVLQADPAWQTAGEIDLSGRTAATDLLVVDPLLFRLTSAPFQLPAHESAGFAEQLVELLLRHRWLVFGWRGRLSAESAMHRSQLADELFLPMQVGASWQGLLVGNLRSFALSNGSESVWAVWYRPPAPSSPLPLGLDVHRVERLVRGLLGLVLAAPTAPYLARQQLRDRLRSSLATDGLVSRLKEVEGTARSFSAVPSLEAFRLLLFLSRLLERWRKDGATPPLAEDSLAADLVDLDESAVLLLRWRIMEKTARAAKREFQLMKQSVKDAAAR